ncbi:hypothetical protein M9980_10835 [Sphingomonas donggukensis]|uniref:Cyclic GMP-AMP synthase n=1 Tax=Sphingomonas donggukensis TaxID=2949093 RepID=A0ABY4TRP2_9SPHN|nr:hypothetical protein [Sphingomonas donggukensis]URW75050.1 hypothetical protein M9980_10835 [Sphingomonas donggukensis]
MAMYDLSADLLTFHDKHVKLDSDSEKRLAEVRDTNLDRIRNGLADLGKASFKNWRNQGGYAMGTVINDPAGESNHDIDVALVFDEGDLPSGALAARQRVRDALCKRGTNFLHDPEARTNAVTVWYADGYHLDFAVYRRSTSIFQVEKHEHASTDWVEREPAEVTSWFMKAVDDKSPKADAWGNPPAVRVNQLRRIVRLVKWFCRSRTSWNLPGGMIASTLVVECYRADAQRDDVALYNTLAAIEARLRSSCRVYHPNGGARELTGKAEYLNQVTLMQEKLTANMPKLSVLFDADCTRDKARSAWDWIFNHAFWAGKEVLEEASLVKADTGLSGYWVRMGCDLAKSERGRIIGRYRGQVVPKNLGLRFFVEDTNVPQPFSVRYEVTNKGDEAQQAKQLEWSGEASGDDPEWWTSTAYKGTHRMTCNVVRNGVTVASSSIIVKIVGGIFRGRR